MTICDVSYYQNTIDSKNRIYGAIDWWKMATRANGVIIRAGFGSNLDIQFVRNWNDSKGVLKRGAYWYFKADTSPIIQAELLLQFAQEPELPLAVDLEWRQSIDGLAAKPGAKYLGQVMEFLSTIEAAKHKPVIYSSMGHILSYLPRPGNTSTNYDMWAHLGDYDLWLAQYSKDPRITLAAPNVPQPWIDYRLWQCSADGNGLGKAYGVYSKSIDLNRESRNALP